MRETKEYGSKKSEHLGICIECKEEKIVRWYLTDEWEEIEICDDCYKKN